MNRRLHNATLAAAASGFLLAFGLMASAPLLPSASAASSVTTIYPVAAAAHAPPTAAAAPASATTDSEALARRHADLLETRLDARARAFEARIAASADSASVGDTVASAMAFAAEITTEVALVSALGALEAGSSDAAADARDIDIDIDVGLDERRRHAQRVRGVLAVPYFSFAPAMRGAGS